MIREELPSGPVLLAAVVVLVGATACGPTEQQTQPDPPDTAKIERGPCLPVPGVLGAAVVAKHAKICQEFLLGEGDNPTIVVVNFGPDDGGAMGRSFGEYLVAATAGMVKTRIAEVQATPEAHAALDRKAAANGGCIDPNKSTSDGDDAGQAAEDTMPEVRKAAIVLALANYAKCRVPLGGQANSGTGAHEAEIFLPTLADSLPVKLGIRDLEQQTVACILHEFLHLIRLGHAGIIWSPNGTDMIMSTHFNLRTSTNNVWDVGAYLRAASGYSEYGDDEDDMGNAHAPVLNPLHLEMIRSLVDPDGKTMQSLTQPASAEWSAVTFAQAQSGNYITMQMPQPITLQDMHETDSTDGAVGPHPFSQLAIIPFVQGASRGVRLYAFDPEHGATGDMGKVYLQSKSATWRIAVDGNVWEFKLDSTGLQVRQIAGLQ